MQIQQVLKYLAPEIPALAPAALSWALTMHRLFASLTGEGEEIPRSHVDAIVNPLRYFPDPRQTSVRLKMAMLNGTVSLLN